VRSRWSVAGSVLAFAAGAVLAFVAGYFGWRTRALTASGAGAAWIVGTTVFCALRWRGAATVFAFFLPAALLSARKKPERRNARQVFANGAVAAACALFARRSTRCAWGFAGALAAAAADTWATEIGTRSKTPARSILTGAVVQTGRSGGVTPLGTLAELAGAMVVAAAAYPIVGSAWWRIAFAGFFGATVDSVLGASLQALYYCADCASLSERNPHTCGTRAAIMRGVPSIDNDAVNFLATCAGAFAAAALYFA